MAYTLLSCLDSKIIHNTHFYGKFKLGPFQPGQSLTVANTLRRSLLSELSGTSITLVQIEGTSHEYETILGVQECTLDLLLNIKKLVLKTDFDFYTPQVGFLNKKGPGIVRARDLHLPFFVSIIDPDQYIATLSSTGKLNMKVLINCGKTALIHSPNSNHFQHWVNLLNQTKPVSPFAPVPNKLEKKSKEDKIVDEMTAAILEEHKLNSKTTQTKLKKEDKNKKTTDDDTDGVTEIKNKNEKIEQEFSNLTFEQQKQQEQEKIQKNLRSRTLFYDWQINANRKNKILVQKLLKQKNLKIKETVTKPTVKKSSKKITTEENVKPVSVITSSKNEQFLRQPLLLPFASSFASLSQAEVVLQTKATSAFASKAKAEAKVASKDKEARVKKQKTFFNEKSTLQIKKKLGYFPIDAVFSPVSKVNYSIELKNHFSKQEIIFLEIWTNGAINPRSAIHKTVKGLIQLFLPLQQIKKQIKPSFFSNKTPFTLKTTLPKSLPSSDLYPSSKLVSRPILIKKKNKIKPGAVFVSASSTVVDSPSSLLLKKQKQTQAKIKEEKEIKSKPISTSTFKKQAKIIQPTTLTFNLSKSSEKEDVKKQKTNVLDTEKKDLKQKQKLTINQESIKKRDPATSLILEKRFKAQFLNSDITNLALNSRVITILKKQKIHKIKDLLMLSNEQLMKIPSFLPKYVKNVELIFKQYKSWLE